MALIPENYTEPLDEASVPVDTSVEIAPAKTWAIDFVNGTIGGTIDEEDALRQFAVKALMTERLRYIIYTSDYGCELRDLVGGDITYSLMDAEIPRMIYETLAYDDRIEDVVDITYKRDGDKLFISFRIVPESGAPSFTQEVTL